MLEQRITDAEALGLDPQKVETLLARVRREVDEGLLPAAQVAVARHGKVGVFESYGDAKPDSLTPLFSATKAITSAAAWLLFQEGKLAEEELVADIIPEFASNGKDVITVEQLFTHTAGFPHAPFRPLQWLDKTERADRYQQWRLTWEPGTRFEYHPSSSMWVIAEIIERRSGTGFTEFVRDRVLNPLQLHDMFVGLPDSENARSLPCSHAGDPLTEEDFKKMGMPVPPETEVTEEAILNLLASARRIRTGDMTDPMFRKPANRGLGIIISGDESRSFRGFGKTNSPQAFGHNGAGGQLAWVDPASGISLGYVTPGHDRNSIRQARRGVAISSLAAECAL
jgi:CubicO group peptidase (beta-lactamase class C family)